MKNRKRENKKRDPLASRTTSPEGRVGGGRSPGGKLRIELLLLLNWVEFEQRLSELLIGHSQRTQLIIKLEAAQQGR